MTALLNDLMKSMYRNNRFYGQTNIVLGARALHHDTKRRELRLMLNSDELLPSFYSQKFSHNIPRNALKVGSQARQFWKIPTMYKSRDGLRRGPNNHEE